MKKYIFYAFMAMFSITSMFTLSSCGDDDDEKIEKPNDPEGPDKIPSLEITAPAYDAAHKRYAITLIEGETFQIKAEAFNHEDRTISYFSSDESVARVDKSGHITAVCEGITFIWVKTNLVEKRISVTVKSYAQLMIGHWSIYAYRSDIKDAWEDCIDMNMMYQFNNNGTYSALIGDFETSGTYYVKDTYIHMVNEKKRPENIEIFNYKNGTATFSFYAEGSNDKPTYYFRVGRIPLKSDEAKAMIVGTWQLASSADTYVKEYQQFAEDGNLYYIFEIDKNCPSSSGWYAKYRGKTVGYVGGRTYKVAPTSSDFREGEITMTNDLGGYSTTYYFEHLSQGAFKGSWEKEGFVTFLHVDDLDFTLISQPD